MLKRIISTLLAVLLFLPSVSFAETPRRDVFSVKKVEIFRDGKLIDRPVQAGDEVEVAVTLESSQLKNEDLASEKEVILKRLQDSFSGEQEAQIEILSKPGEALLLRGLFHKLNYSGNGQELQYHLQWKTDAVSEQKGRLELRDCQPGKKEVPQPQALIRRNEMKEDLMTGQRVSFTFTVQNVGQTTMKAPVARIKTSEGLSIPSGNSSYLLGDIEAGKTREFTVELKAAEEIASPKQTVEIDVRFHYDSGTSTLQGQATDTVEVPVKAKVEQGEAPLIILSHPPIASSIEAGSSLPLTITIKNSGKETAQSPVFSANVTDGLMISDGQSSYALKDIKAGESQELTIHLKGAPSLSATLQHLEANLRYSYHGKGGTQKDSVSERIAIPVKGNEDQKGPSTTDQGSSGSSSGDGGSGNYSSGISTPKLDSAVPNVIIKQYNYGGKPVAAGSSFELSLEYTNTSKKVGVENIVMTVEPGEHFSIDSASNIHYIDTMGAGTSQQKLMKLRALPSAKTGAQTIEVTFKYEYVDNDKRSQSSITQKISVPVLQPDRFQVSPPEIPQTVRVGEEVTLNLPYVNKGKSDVSNVEASVEGNVPTATKSQNLGNFEAGKSGNISYLVTPDKVGDLKFTLKVSYEDANQEVKVKEFPVQLKVEQGAVPETDEGKAEMPTEAGGPGSWPWLLGFLGLSGAGTVLFLRHKKKAKQQAEELDWNDEVE